MGIIGGELGYMLLRHIAPRSRNPHLSARDDTEPAPDTHLDQCFGSDFYDLIKGKTVIDFGCGHGNQSVGMALMGAGKVIGLDIQEHFLERGRQTAIKFDVADRCTFTSTTNELADIIISSNAFEHFSDPAAILKIMSTLIKPTGIVCVAFGPTWYHPYGGHLFSVFPWSHLIFTEKAQIRWRSDFKSDGATKFSEVAGGLNQISIAQFERIVEESPLQFVSFETVPIKGIGLLKTKLLREIGTSIVRGKLALKNNPPPQTNVVVHSTS